MGGIWTIGLIVAPLLFSALSRDVASGLTWRLLGTMGWVGLVCAAVLLVDWLWRHGLAGMREAGFWLLLLMLACTLVNHFAIAPMLVGLKASAAQAATGVFGGGFATWQAISSLLLLVQSLCGLVYVTRTD
ncbi:MAG: DUF4149 domain-containing protein [Laribacter sp.]|nr:DUF4149 domain-containing protein [Laribacter sp.]MBP9608888.1 DUF4149 domain-containing protein [Laribacter sp.]